jgi:hypothetical protein
MSRSSGERVTSGLSLESQGILSLPHLNDSSRLVEDHQVHDALARTPRHRRATEVFHRDAWEMRLDEVSNPFGDFGDRGRVVLAGGGRCVLASNQR